VDDCGASDFGRLRSWWLVTAEPKSGYRDSRMKTGLRASQPRYLSSISLNEEAHMDSNMCDKAFHSVLVALFIWRANGLYLYFSCMGRFFISGFSD